MMRQCGGQARREVNAAFVEPSYIAAVRKKLDLDQREAAELFGGGVNAFSRYENGKTKPPLALLQLLRLLDNHPDLLAEIVAGALAEDEPAQPAREPPPLKRAKKARARREVAHA